MSFERHPAAIAVTTTDDPIVLKPGFTRVWPEEVIFTLPNNYDGAKGWSTSFESNGSGNTRAYVTASTLGDFLYAFTGGDSYVSVNPTPSLLVYRTIRGLMPGRKYRLTARVGPRGGTPALSERARIRMGGQASSWVVGDSSMPFLQRSLTFTATADEEDLIVEVADNPASSNKSNVADVRFANIVVTGLAYTETVPPVLDDQIPLPIYTGELAADAGWAPYLQGTVTVPLASDELGAALDPNGGSRFQVTASSIIDLVQQWNDWAVSRRNMHPDPGLTLPAVTLSGDQGALFGGYTVMPGSNPGVTDRLNQYQVGSGGIQVVTARNLPAGTHVGFDCVITAPSTANRTRVLLKVEPVRMVGLDTDVRSTLVAVLQVLDGATVVTERVTSLADTAALLTIDQLLTVPPTGLRIRVFIANRGSTTWTSSHSFSGFGVRVFPDWSAVMEGDQSVTPFISDRTTVPPAQAGTLRYRRVGTSTVEEIRTLAEPTIGRIDERTFDLALASREINHERGEMTLELASDEYLLQRFSKTTDDKTPRTREHSLRSVIEYVAGEALGVVPPLAGTVDADVTARWALSNLLVNPSLELTDANWRAVGGGPTLARVNLSAPVSPSGTNVLRATGGVGSVAMVAPVGEVNDITAAPGQPYTFSAYVCTSGTGRTARAVLQWRRADGTVVISASDGTLVSTTSTEWRRVTVTGFAPAGATHVLPYIAIIGTTNGQNHFIDCAMLHEGTEAVEYFDGSTGTTGGYTHGWQGAPHDSPSSRTPIRPRTVESLTWSAGDTAWDFLSPLVSSAGLRLFCDENRVWRLINPNTYTAPGSLTVTPETTVEGKDIIDGERGEYADGVVIHWTWTDGFGVDRTKTETAGTKGKIARLEINAPYPGDGTAAAHLAQLKKRASSTPVTVATDYRATPDQAVTITLPGSTPSTGELASVKWDFATGLMQLEPANL